MDIPKRAKMNLVGSDSSSLLSSPRTEYLRRRKATHISSKYKAKVYKEDINND